MKKLINKILLSISLSIFPFALIAQEEYKEVCLRPVTSGYFFSVGGATLADTYLSPILYKGWNGNFTYSRLQAMAFNPEHWVMNLEIGVDLSRGKNQVGNAILWHGMFRARWSMTHRWLLTGKVTLGVGGFTGIEGGALYLKRNGNNPAAAKGTWNLGARAYVTYPFTIGKIKMMARWQASMPITGIFFSPDYGELYYEIWLGNTKGLVHGAWPGNYFNIENEATLDINCGTNWFRIGYRSNVLSTKTHDITTRIISNNLIFGFSGEWLSLKAASKINSNTRIISALY